MLVCSSRQQGFLMFVDKIQTFIVDWPWRRCVLSADHRSNLLEREGTTRRVTSIIIIQMPKLEA